MPQKHYYVTGNTGAGFVNYLVENLHGIDHVFVLKHESHTVKTSVLQVLMNHYKRSSEVEVLLSSLGKDYLEGIIVRGHAFAVIDDFLHTDQLKNISIIDLAHVVKESEQQSANHKSRQYYLEATQAAYHEFSQGLHIHDALESIYIDEMDFQRADELAEDLLEELFSHVTKKESESVIYSRLFGTNTPQGAVNIVPELIASVNHVYFIKGRAGTGKSTLMKKVIATLKEYGFEMELYYCSFDPTSIDMVLVPELNFCIFDSTDPHEFFPTSNDHQVIDMYKETVKEGTDHRYAEKIKQVTSNYKKHMKQGIKELQNAHTYLRQIEKQYTTNESLVNDMKNMVIKNVAELQKRQI